MLTLAPGLWRTTLDQLRECGAGRVECVSYWTSSLKTPDRIDGVIHPVHTASAGHYGLDPIWLHRFWVELDEQARTARAQVHTHMTAAFHSWTDDTFPLVHVPGFVSLVIPNGAFEPVMDDELWLAEIDHRGHWRRVRLGERVSRA